MLSASELTLMEDEVGRCRWWVQVCVNVKSCEGVDGNRSKTLEVKSSASVLESCGAVEGGRTQLTGKVLAG